MALHPYSPLAGLPPTFETACPQGLPIFTLMPHELTPLRLKIAHAAISISTALLTGGLIIALINASNPPLRDMAAAALIVFAGSAFFGWAIPEALKVTMVIVMTTDTIKVRRLFRWHAYDRNIEHRFALLVHDKAREEQQQRDLILRQGQITNRPLYYSESFHIVLVYAGHRVDLMTVHGQKQAAAIIARLQYCDRRLNEAVRMGGGINQRVDDDWINAPGGLPDE